MKIHPLNSSNLCDLKDDILSLIKHLKLRDFFLQTCDIMLHFMVAAEYTVHLNRQKGK